MTVTTPAQLAEMAVWELDAAPPIIGMVPEEGPGRMGTVGIPVWMWTPPQQWQPQTATATAGDLSVTAELRLSRVVWDMGDGRQVVCTRPGTPYQDSFGMTDSPDCGYRYQQQSGRSPYTITATGYYDVTWTGADVGSTVLSASSTRDLVVGEFQVIIDR